MFWYKPILIWKQWKFIWVTGCLIKDVRISIIYGAPQSKQSRAHEKFETPPQNHTKVLILRPHQGCASYVWSWPFFQNFQNSEFSLLHHSASKKYTATIFIYYVHFECKMAPEDIWLLSYKQKSVEYFQKNTNFQFFQKLLKLFAKYHSNKIFFRGCFVFKTDGWIAVCTQVGT